VKEKGDVCDAQTAILEQGARELLSDFVEDGAK
jgi:hypothetical protein